MKVKDIISTCPKISQDDLASKARAIMRRKNIRALPVFKNNKLIGIITRSDLLKITSTKSNITVGGLLWRPLINLNSDTDIETAAKVILDNGIKQVPIFENNRYIGLVRDIDLLKAFSKRKRIDKKVSEVMTKRVKTFTVDDPISKIWTASLKHSGFPILNKKQVVGIITSKELLNSKKARLSVEAKKTKTTPSAGVVMRIIAGEIPHMTVKPDESIVKATKKILNAGLSILPVIDGKKHLKGIVTKKDLLRGFLK